MMKSKTTKKIQEIEHLCEYCQRTFKRERSLLTHACQIRQRCDLKGEPASRIAYQFWMDFYKKTTNSKKPKMFIDFAKSQYYIAFAKFGNYCVESKVINPKRYFDWLLDSKIAIDQWCKDSIYTKFLIWYLRIEDAMDAVKRSIDTCLTHSEEAGIPHNDFLRYGNKNRICHLITNGSISPWMLYQSASGIKFLENLSEAQQEMVLEYIDPELWTIRFFKDKESVTEVKNLLKTTGY